MAQESDAGMSLEFAIRDCNKRVILLAQDA